METREGPLRCGGDRGHVRKGRCAAEVTTEPADVTEI